MPTRALGKILAFTLVLMISACALPVVTPPVDATEVPTTSFITTPEESATTQTPAQTVAEKISENNVGGLTVTEKVAVANPQWLGWTNDSQSFSVVTQTSDANANQLYGVSTFNAPSLSTKYVYSIQGSRVTSVAADGRTVAVIATDEMSFSLVDLGAGNVVIYTGTPGFRIGNVSFSPDLKYIAVTQAEAWEVVLYSLISGKEVRRLTGFETASPVFNAGFYDSSQWVLWLARGTVQLQDVETGTLGAPFSHEDSVTAFALSSDGALLATAAAKTVNGTFSPVFTLWDTAQGTELRTLILPSSTYALSFSPDGKLLAIGIDNNLQIWRVADGTLLNTFPGHQASIGLVKFSPDGKTIVTAGFDNQLYLWQVLK